MASAVAISVVREPRSRERRSEPLTHVLVSGEARDVGVADVQGPGPLGDDGPAIGQEDDLGRAIEYGPPNDTGIIHKPVGQPGDRLSNRYS